MKEEECTKKAYALLVSFIADETVFQQITNEIQDLLGKWKKPTMGLMTSKTIYVNDVDWNKSNSYWVKYQVPDLSVHEINFLAASAIIEK